MPSSDGRSRVPASYRFVRDACAASEVTAVILLVVITVAGTVVVVSMGSSLLEENREASEIDRTEHAMTLLSSRGSLVALGESDSQTVNLGGSGAGQYHIDENAGSINVTHHNYSDGKNETLYDAPLGAVVYEHGDTSIAYQAGGVWRSDGNGSTMVSAPEFHYRSSTLMLPIVSLEGEGSVSGNVDASVSTVDQPVRIFPNESSTYDETGDPYRNMISNGEVTVTVESEYYQGWAQFFRQRTEGKLDVDHENETVTLYLLGLPEDQNFQGGFGVPEEQNPITVYGLGTNHSMEQFEVELYPADRDASEFNNLQWSMYTEQGSQQFEIKLERGANDNDPTTPCKEHHVEATVYYSETHGDDYHGWQNETAFKTECYDGDGDGVEDQTRFTADLTGDTQMEMTKLESGDLNYYSLNNNDWNDEVTFDEHEAGVDWEAETFEDGNETSVGNLSKHYIELMGPHVDLVIYDGNPQTVSESASSGDIEYERDTIVITYLHITENGIRVELN